MFRLAIAGPSAILLAASAFPAAAQQQPAASMNSTKSPPGVAAKVENKLALPAERLIGRKVHAMAGNDLGRIEDVLVTPDGNVKAVIAAGGVYDIVGADKKRVMIDWDKISFAGGPGKELVADVTLAELAATPDWIQDDARARQSQASDSSDAASGDANAQAGAAGQAATQPTAKRMARVEVSRSQAVGPYLTDGEGRALYMFTADSPGKSACFDACAQAWPPLLSSGEPATGERVDGAKLELIERQGGAMQVAYDGMPLYTFVHDRNKGSLSGQDKHGFGGEWYLVSPQGAKITKAIEDGDRQSGQNAAQSGGASMQPRKATAMLNELSAAGYRPTSDFRRSGDRWLGHASKNGREMAVVINPSTGQIEER